MRGFFLKLSGLGILSGIFLNLGWLPYQMPYFLVLGVMVLLYAERYIVQNKRSLFWFLVPMLIAFSMWFAIGMSWVTEALPQTWALVLAAFINFILYYPLLGFYPFVKKYLGKLLGYVFLITGWVGIEWVNEVWEWMNAFFRLGNGLGGYPELIQWYEFTGVAGGSIWLLLISVLLFECVLKWNDSKKSSIKIRMYSVVPLLLIVIVPVFLSLLRYYTYEEKGRECNILTVHPSIETDKVENQVTQDSMIRYYSGLMHTHLDSTTDFVLWPESALRDGGWLTRTAQNATFDSVRFQIKNYPDVSIITGTIAFDAIHPSIADKYKENTDVHYSAQHNVYYRIHNGAFKIAHDKEVEFRAKKKFVPVWEKIPYENILFFARSIVGDTLGLLTFYDKPHPDVFKSEKGNVLPLICYEMIFSDATASYVRKGAEVIVIISNEDSLFSDYHLQTYQYSFITNIRAIENRKYVVRSSNCGITEAVDQRGISIGKIDQFKKGESRVFKVLLNDQHTIYAFTGDVISKGGILLSLLILSFSFLIFFRNKENKYCH